MSAASQGYAILAVALGGALGAATRYWLVLQATLLAPNFPLGTLLVNALGCLLLGALVPSLAGVGTPWLVLAVGFCGGFTTMSAFSLDTWNLIEAGQFARAAGYGISTFIVSLACFFLGAQISRLLLKS